MAGASPGTSRTAPVVQSGVLRSKSIGVIGLGQIGGSIVRSLARLRPEISVYGTDRDPALVWRVRRYCRWRPGPAELVADCHVVVLAVPVPAAIALLPALSEYARERRGRGRLVVMDTGTVKQEIVAAARRHLRRFDFVGLHPLAGREWGGWPSGHARLFKNRRIVYCPGSGARAAAIARQLIGLLGAIPVRMDPAVHDRLAALVIGLPHVLAFAAIGLSERSRKPNSLRGGSWESLTRVARSDPEMVAGFLSMNRRELRRTLTAFRKNLDRVMIALERQDSPALCRILESWNGGTGHRTGPQDAVRLRRIRSG